VPFLANLPWVVHYNYIWRRLQVVNFLIMQFSPILRFHPSSVQIFSSIFSLIHTYVYTSPIREVQRNYSILLLHFQQKQGSSTWI
jgi:hypothetical protein